MLLKLKEQSINKCKTSIQTYFIDIKYNFKFFKSLENINNDLKSINPTNTQAITLSIDSAGIVNINFQLLKCYFYFIIRRQF